MSDKKIPIEEATVEQLRAFASAYLGLDIHGSTKEENVRARVAKAWGKPEILVPDAGEDETVVARGGQPPHPVTAAHQPPDKGKVRLIIQRTDDSGGNDPVFVSVNGRAMLVPRGKEVEIPYRYFRALEKAVIYRYEPLPDGGIDPVPRKIPLYPFQRVA